MENIHALKKEIELLRSANNRLEDKISDLTDCIENASVPMHWIDAHGIILWANTADLDILGYNKDEYIGSSILNYHTDKHVIMDILVRSKGNEIIKNYPADLRCKDGSIIHVLISTSIRKKDEKFIHTRCFTRDVTSLVKEEESRNKLVQRLEENETKLRLAIESTKMGTWYWDTSTNDIYISDEGRKILGMKSNIELNHHLFLQYLFPNNYKYLEKNKVQLSSEGKEGYFDTTQNIQKADGSKGIIRIQGAAHETVGGSARFIGTIVDVTEMVIAHENDELLAAIIRSSNDAIVGKTLNGTIKSWNAAAERIFGFSEQEMLGTSIYAIVPEDKKEEEASILAKLRKGERMEYFETKRLTKSGITIDVSLTISPIKDVDGKIIGISKIARDITDKKQEEKRKHDFVTMVSHEIKTPLTSILLYTQILLKVTKEGESSNVHSLGSKIEALTKKIILMVKDYLSLSKIGEGKIDLNKEDFDLGKLVNEIVEDAKLLTSKHDIEIKGLKGITVFADPNKLEQVLVNLLSNAIKYSPAGGGIKIEYEPYAEKVRISVIDQGIGIHWNDQKVLFKKFSRIDKASTHSISGFGIGLYLVAEILKNHGSKIHVKSKEGEGSRFYFDIERGKS